MFFKIRPTYIVEHVRDINLHDLKAEGIKALLFDLDNTLMEPYSGKFQEEIADWIKEIQKDFKIAILSNNLKAEYIEQIQNIVDFPVYGRAGKPFRATAFRVIKELGVLPEQCAIVGDTFLTDIILGLRLGIVTVLVDSLVKKGEPEYWQFIQKIERSFIKSAKKTFTKKLISKNDFKQIGKVAVILNPESGKISIKLIKEEIEKGFKEYKIFEITPEEDAYKLSKRALEEGFETIVAAGGDGTIKAVISGIYGSNAKLGIIPSGTGNLMAANLGIPLNIPASIKLINKGITRKIDIGKLNDNYAAFMAGCGLNATVMAKTTREKKKQFGYFAYFLEGIKQGFSPESFNFKIKIDDKKPITVQASTILIANSANIFGDVFSLAPKASFYDGEMDLIIICVLRKIDYLYAFLSILGGQHFKKFSRIQHYKFSKVEISSDRILDIQIDGDILDKTPFTVTVIPAAINVLVFPE
ncbi:MAG TPA: YqeG family HAD IIIA-type phosphatase [Candidatus Gastranaerophilales bacterium]|nr:YqeG family HAD IIIA-type phosphatase [Candidatus Gastranaerophilales bacterium]